MEKDLEYYENLDKRTKEYKEWKANQEAEPKTKGLGDSIEKITKATGISDVVKFIAGEDCGCDERKEKLNELFPYKNPECFTEEEYNWIGAFIRRKPTKVTAAEQKTLYSIYNRVFHSNKQTGSCKSCVQEIYDALKFYYEKYS